MTQPSPDRMRDFIRSLDIVRHVPFPIDGAIARRLNAHIDRIDAAEPGLGREPGESQQDTLQIALRALVDRGLRESEIDAGLLADGLTGELRPAGPVVFRIRVRRAWRVLRRGW